MAFDLAGKVVLVVGAADRLGACLADALREAGATVAVTSATGEVIAGGTALDVSDSAAVDTAVARVSGEHGRIDVVVNNADLEFARPVTEVSDGEWSRVIAVNLGGAFNVARAAGAAMLEQGRGKIVNVIPLLGDRGMANTSAYCAAKAGVMNLTRALAAEWARRGITVTGLVVGFLEGSKFTEDRGGLERYLPMRRLGTPEEVAPAIIYLASDESGFMTGQFLALEGGAWSHI